MNIYVKYFNRYKVLFFTAVSCVLMEALCDLMQPTIMSRIIDSGIKSGSMEDILRYGSVMLAVTALGAGFAAARNILASKVSQNFGADLREDVFKKIVVFSESSADKIESGSLITRMTNDTSQIITFINGMMRIFFKAPVMCAGSIILAVILSPKLSVVLFAAVAAVTVFIVISMKLSYIRFAKVQYAIDRVNTVVQEYLLGVRLVKAFGRYEDEEKKFGRSNENLSEKSVSSQLVIAYFSPLMTLSINLGIAAILFYGSLLFGKGDIEVGKIAAFITYMAQIMTSLIMITNVFNTFVRTKASTERIKEVLDSEEDFQEEASDTDSDFTEIEFRDVTFAYPNGSGLPALKNLSFKVKKGETLAVIGPTGSGKSTLAWLCLRFYDADQGKILINGKEIKKIDPHTLRVRISLAPQKSMLFSGTVLNNISWGNSEATEAQIAEAAQAAQADGFIRDMPKGYDSILGQAGVNISGGQKQRISIARALVRKSPVVILDDCTSALDAVTESKVRRGIAELSAGTVILITQRVAAAMSADRILVLENGACAGFGDHAELMASCKIYKEIFDSQIGEEFDR
jgi:ABC-type multidrug transport system, ATPase and permease components